MLAGQHAQGGGGSPRPAEGTQNTLRGDTDEIALAYLRVSTAPQQDNARGLDQQLAEIQSYCEEQDYTLAPGNVFRDVMSGERRDRRGFFELLAAIESRDGTVVVAYDVDRFGRNLKDNALLLSEADDRGLRVETVTGRRDYLENAEGEFFYGLMSLMSQYLNQKRAGRFQRGREKTHERGYWPSGPPPLGYKLRGPQGAKILVPDHNATLIVEVFQRYAAGESQRSIAEWFRDLDPDGEMGLPRWQASIGRLLQNDTYTGRITYQDVTVDGRHEPIVSEELWERVHERLARQRARYNRD